ncbi:Dr1-associated corepressor like [Actinidia chinensis var. chinensis]|uniref:Dr1-associated corepressor like n=1 Tax=Actinidia chinensis var. chinensis TaxID=1590841 RepID=A0A2R6P7Y9_ACTCC|nr:Dr1-associated corepressor like [Actinidia chinensis var. chinensis]
MQYVCGCVGENRSLCSVLLDLNSVIEKHVLFVSRRVSLSRVTVTVGVLHSSNAMRKKLDTRFPAARIKKIMQADEEVGKIAMAVPLLVSKALELFLQDLCDRTYEITLQRGAKTVNSFHL